MSSESGISPIIQFYDLKMGMVSTMNPARMGLDSSGNRMDGARVNDQNEWVTYEMGPLWSYNWSYCITPINGLING